jgi:hypothetical protein
MMKKFSSNVSAGLVITLAMFMMMFGSLTSSLKAQSSSGAIVGTVTDTSGAAVPGSTVTLTNIGTNDKKTMEADAAGNYRFVTLPPAQYKVEVSAPGFKRVVQTPITVQVDSTVRVDAKLDIGAVSETVQVTTQAALLQTESGTLGSQVEGKTVEEMPLNGRNTMNLIALVPGVVPQGSAQGSTSMNQGDHSNNSGWGNYQIGGSIAGQGTIVIDGAPDNAIGGNVVGYVPTQEAIQEFKVSTSAASPEFGRFAGGVVEMSTKSGSNQWHGSAYEYLRNTDLDANTYSQNLNNAQAVAAGGTASRQKLNQNQYGGLFSGPAIKDKAFFMFSWEGFKSRIGEVSSPFSVPTPGMLGNDSSNPGAIVFSDPSVQLVEPNKNLTGQGNLWNKEATTGGNCVSTTDAGLAVVNAACVDQTALKIARDYFPDVTKAPYSGFYNPNASLGSGNFTPSYVIGNNNYQYSIRGDAKLSANQQLFARYTYMKMTDIGANPLLSANGFNTSNAGSTYFTHQAVVGDTYTINPTTIADVRLSYMRSYSDNLQATEGTSAAKSFINGLGDSGGGWATIASQGTAPQLPSLTLGGQGPNPGPDNFYSFRALGSYSRDWYNTYALSASVVKIHGNHTFKIGGELRLLNKNNIGTGSDPGGSITTSSKSQQGNQFANDEWANFMLGLTSSTTAATGISAGDFNWYQGYYVSDTWAVNRQLTLNLGLRWELPGAVGEKHNNGTIFMPDYIDPNTGVKGVMTLLAEPNGLWRDRYTESSIHDLLSPRLGFAYRVSNNTVVRGGYALTYLAPDMGSVLPDSSPVNSATTTGANSNQGNAVTYTVESPLQTINANGSANTTTGSTVQFLQPSGRAVPVNNFGATTFESWFETAYNAQNNNRGFSSEVPTTGMSYFQQWNLSVGQQFKGQQSLEVGFAGALGIHLLPSGGSVGIDEPSQAQAEQIAACTGSCNARQYTPYPNYGNVTNANPYDGTMNYNSLQVRYEKRFTSGMITSGYTFSKSIGTSDTSMSWLDNGNDGAIQDYNNLKGERSLLSFSMKNRWVTSYVLNLPFGKGQKFLNSSNGIVDRVVGGWAVNGITMLQSGQPIMLTYHGRNSYSNWNAGTLRPNYDPSASGCNGKAKSGSAQSRLSEWFNTSCFTAPGSGFDFGNEPRVDNNLTTSGMANWDFSAVKSTAVTEKTNLQFRVEFFNVFNRRQWGMPNNDASNPQAFGQVTGQQNNPRQIQASLRFAF